MVIAMEEIAQNAVKIDDTVTANLGGRDGAEFDPAAYDIHSNDVDAQQLGEHML